MTDTDCMVQPGDLSMPMFAKLSPFALSTLLASATLAQAPVKPDTSHPKPADTEIWTPVPAIITPGHSTADPPSDAIILFDGRNQDEWVLKRDGSPPKRTAAGGMRTVNNLAGDMQTNRLFTNYQL